MSDNADVNLTETETGPVVIGISLGSSNSSIAFTSPDGKAEVIANEDGGMRL